MKTTLTVITLVASLSLSAQRMPIDTNTYRIEPMTAKADFKVGKNLFLGSIAPTFTGLGLLTASYLIKAPKGSETQNSLRAAGIGVLGISAIVKVTGLAYMVRGGKRSRGKTVSEGF